MRGLPLCRSAAAALAPIPYRENIEQFNIALAQQFGIATLASFKASTWTSEDRDFVMSGDPTYACVVLHCGGNRVWRNREKTPAEAGCAGMHPFDEVRWRFDGDVSYMHVYVPFRLISDVCESIFGREMEHSQLWMPMGERDPLLCGALESIRAGLRYGEPSILLGDSWALRLSELLVTRYSSYVELRQQPALGKLPLRGLARVVEYVDAYLGEPLELARLAEHASMSVYHFARRFKQTTGVSPHAYVVRQRIRRAQFQLKQGDLAISDIAASCGFASQSHLTQAFHRIVGASPDRYRREFRTA